MMDRILLACNSQALDINACKAKRVPLLKQEFDVMLIPFMHFTLKPKLLYSYIVLFDCEHAVVYTGGRVNMVLNMHRNHKAY